MIRCLVVDDSRAFRAILRAILARAADVEVVGEASDGDEAVRRALALRPDVITMDVRMPGKDGLSAIEEIMRVSPAPIVVVSAEVGPEKQEVAFRALELGAVEVLAKPRSDREGRFEREAEEIRAAIRTVAGLRLSPDRPRPPVRSAPPPAPPRPKPPAPRAVPPPRPRDDAPRALGIAASTGGPAALARILRALPAEYPIPILIVQHIAHGFEGGLAHWLGSESSLRVRLAADGDPVEPGTVYLAPDGWHLGVVGDRLRLTKEPAVRGFRPSGTMLLASLAREYGATAAGLVLSGMGDDGADGLRQLRDRGGWTAAQGPRSSVVYGMPRVAVERGGAERTLELDEIAPALLRLAGLDPRGGA